LKKAPTREADLRSLYQQYRSEPETLWLQLPDDY